MSLTPCRAVCITTALHLLLIARPTTMSGFTSLLSGLNIFKNYSVADTVSLAVKDNNQVFLAALQLIKTSLINSRKNYFKLLDPKHMAAEEIKALTLNLFQSVLAIVYDSSVAILSTRDLLDFESEDVLLPARVLRRLPDLGAKIKSVLWHPASPRYSELVVLTEKEIVLYDIIVSSTQPMLLLALDLYPELKGKTVLSIAFGSLSTLPGSVTLYLSTECGEIYSIFPFLYEGSSIGALKQEVDLFVQECEEVIDSVTAAFPPAALLKSYHMECFSKQYEFASLLRNQASDNWTSGSDLQRLARTSPNTANLQHNLQGPLAKVGDGARLLTLDSAQSTSFLVAVSKDANSKAQLTYLAQFKPLIMDFKEPASALTPPTKATSAPVRAKEEKYAKPSRGFGFVVLSDSEDDDEELDKLLADYAEQLSIYNLKAKTLEYFSSNFNSLSTVAIDSSDVAYDKLSSPTLQSLQDSKFLLANGGSALVASTGDAIRGAFNNEASAFEAEYQKFTTSATTFAYVKDTTEGSGSYVIAASPNAPVEVFQVESTSITTKSVSVESSNKIELPLGGTYQGDRIIPHEELKALLGGSAKPLAPISGFNPSSVDSLSKVHQLTATVGNSISDLTKFMLTLKAKLAIQHEELKFQVQDLDAVHTMMDDTNKKYELNEKRIQAAKERQEKLLERQKNLHSGLLNNFEKKKAEVSIPLSKEERKWFKEINKVIATINESTPENPSLKSTVSTLNRRIESLKNWEDSSLELGLSGQLKKLLLGPELTKLKHSLIKEDKIIANTRAKLDAAADRLLSRA